MEDKITLREPYRKGDPYLKVRLSSERLLPLIGESPWHAHPESPISKFLGSITIHCSAFLFRENDITPQNGPGRPRFVLPVLFLPTKQQVKDEFIYHFWLKTDDGYQAQGAVNIDVDLLICNADGDYVPATAYCLVNDTNPKSLNEEDFISRKVINITYIAPETNESQPSRRD